MADHARHARVGDHARGEHRVGGRQQRADAGTPRSSDRPVSTLAASATITAVIGIASTSLRSGRCHARCSISASTSRPSRNRITISATIARSCTKPERGSNSSTSEPAVAEHEAREDEQRGQRQEGAPREARQQRARRRAAPPSTIARRLERGHAGTVPHARRRGGIDETCGSPCWASRRPGRTPDGACSGYLVEEDGACLLLDCGNGVFAKLRRFVDYVDVDAVVISHLHADHFLDLVPVRLRADLRAAPAAGAGRPLAGHRQPGAPAAATRRAGGRDALRRVVGGGGMHEDHIEHAFELHEYDPDDVARRSAAARALPAACRTSCPRAPSTSRSTNGGGRFTYGADCAPNDELVRFADGTDLLMIEATLPRPEREGPRGHLTPVGGRRARRKAARAPARAHPHLRRARRRLGAREAEQAFGGPVDVAREGAVFTRVGTGTSRKPSALVERPRRVGLGDHEMDRWRWPSAASVRAACPIRPRGEAAPLVGRGGSGRRRGTAARRHQVKSVAPPGPPSASTDRADRRQQAPVASCERRGQVLDDARPRAGRDRRRSRRTRPWPARPRAGPSSSRTGRDDDRLRRGGHVGQPGEHRSRRGRRQSPASSSDLDLARVEAHVVARLEHALQRIDVGPADVLDAVQRPVGGLALVGACRGRVARVAARRARPRAGGRSAAGGRSRRRPRARSLRASTSPSARTSMRRELRRASTR